MCAMTPHDTDEQLDNSRLAASIGPGASAEAPTRSRNLVARVVLVLVVVATSGILLRGLLTPAAQPVVTNTSTPAPAAPQIGHLAPNLTLLDLRNHRVPLSSLRGKVVILNFWYATCEPCLLEMPDLEKVYRAQQGKGLVVVGLNTSDDAQTITDFLRRLGITYPVLGDVGQRTVVAY